MRLGRGRKAAAGGVAHIELVLDAITGAIDALRGRAPATQMAIAAPLPTADLVVRRTIHINLKIIVQWQHSDVLAPCHTRHQRRIGTPTQMLQFRIEFARAGEPGQALVVGLRTGRRGIRRRRQPCQHRRIDFDLGIHHRSAGLQIADPGQRVVVTELEVQLPGRDLGKEFRRVAVRRRGLRAGPQAAAQGAGTAIEQIAHTGFNRVGDVARPFDHALRGLRNVQPLGRQPVIVDVDAVEIGHHQRQLGIDALFYDRLRMLQMQRRVAVPGLQAQFHRCRQRTTESVLERGVQRDAVLRRRLPRIRQGHRIAFVRAVVAAQFDLLVGCRPGVEITAPGQRIGRHRDRLADRRRGHRRREFEPDRRQWLAGRRRGTRPEGLALAVDRAAETAPLERRKTMQTGDPAAFHAWFGSERGTQAG